MKKFKLITFVVTLVTSIGVHALGVDTLIKVMNSDQDVLSISNQDGYRQFVTLTISEVTVIDGQLVFTPYTKENIETWSFETRPSKTIIDDGQSKKFAIRYFGEKDLSYDKMYSINVVPKPYFNEGEIPPNTVQIVIGVAPYVIVPAKEDKPLSYEIKHDGKAIVVKNLGKTYFNAVLKGCDSTILQRQFKDCFNGSYVLAGRELTIALPEKSDEKIEVSLKTNNNTYKQTFNMTPGQVKKQ